MSGERARARHGPAPLLATVAILVAALLLLCGPATPAEARIQSLRVTNMASQLGFKSIDSVNCNEMPAYTTGCVSQCVSFSGLEPSEDSKCSAYVTPYCGATSSGGGQWCSIMVELEATMDLPGSTSSDRAMKMLTRAPNSISIQKVSGPTYVAATTAVPENRARWRYNVSAAVSVETTTVTFASAQGNNERAITYDLTFTCPSLAPTYRALVLDPPKVHCSDGTIRANATVKGCPSFAPDGDGYYYDSTGWYSDIDYMAVFDANTPISTYVDNLPVYTGSPNPALNANLYSKEVFRDLNTTGAGKIEVVLRRKLLTNSLTYPFPRAPWPTNVVGVRLGYRYRHDNVWRPSINQWFLTNPVYYRDIDGDGFGVTLNPKPVSTIGTCDCNDNDATKTKTC